MTDAKLHVGGIVIDSYCCESMISYSGDRVRILPDEIHRFDLPDGAIGLLFIHRPKDTENQT